MPIGFTQMTKNYYIAGWKTVEDWKSFRENLENESSETLWSEAINEYFMKRLELRFLHPIKVLQENGTFVGEGFSIMVILCSLIEFLESTYQGKIYNYTRNNKLKKHEYSSSKAMFISFLLNRQPFSKYFDRDLVEEFYSNIRCGLLHEASTKGGWRIEAKSRNGTFVDKNKKIVYRDNFEEAIRRYISDYRVELKSNKECQKAFIRKFNSL
jgi:hypothetical protein